MVLATRRDGGCRETPSRRTRNHSSLERGAWGALFSLSGVVGLRTDAVTQEERLWIADPKAIHHILQGSSDLYQRPESERELLAAIMDKGLSWSAGELPLTPRIVSP